MSVLAKLSELVAQRPPTLGTGRLVCIDGPAGSGKSTLAELLAQAHRHDDVRLLHMDDMFAGWSGLSKVDEQLDGLLTPIAEGRQGSYRRYDWPTGAFAETIEVPPAPMVVLEGVGSGVSRFSELQTVLVWVEAPHDTRLRRGLERDGEAFAPYWDQWAIDEEELFARERTRERADVLVDGTLPY